MNPRWLAAVLVVLGGCSRPAPSLELRVSAAISLRAPLEALGRRYEAAHPGTRVVFSFGASGDLATQIARGAPVDLFASAASEPVERLAPRVRAEVLCSLAANELVLVRQPGEALSSLRWETLATDPAVEHVAIGIAPAVPAGVYAERTFRALHTLDALGPKLVRGANARQVLELVARGEAEAGVVYATDARGRSDVVVIGPPPLRARPVVRYPMALLVDGRNAWHARALGAWLCGPDGRAGFTAFGFAAP